MKKFILSSIIVICSLSTASYADSSTPITASLTAAPNLPFVPSFKNPGAGMHLSDDADITLQSPTMLRAVPRPSSEKPTIFPGELVGYVVADVYGSNNVGDICTVYLPAVINKESKGSQKYTTPKSIIFSVGKENAGNIYVMPSNKDYICYAYAAPGFYNHLTVKVIPANGAHNK